MNAEQPAYAPARTYHRYMADDSLASPYDEHTDYLAYRRSRSSAATHSQRDVRDALHYLLFATMAIGMLAELFTRLFGRP